jgi:hypothetical protein
VESTISPTGPILPPDYPVLHRVAMVKLSNQSHLMGGINNLTDQAYFTNRTAEYPGAGIIPALRMSFYVSFGALF